MTVLDHAFVLLLGVAYLVHGVVVVRQMRRAPGVAPTVDRAPTYVGTIVWLALLTVVVALLWRGGGRSAARLGLATPAGRPFLIGVVGVAALGVTLAGQRWLVKRDARVRRWVRGRLAGVASLLPGTRRETILYMLLALVAGVCEEIVFRGYLMWYVETLLGSRAAAVVGSSLLFALAHAYQGSRGVTQAGVVGAGLALAYVFTGSLWIPIVLHVMINVNAGRLARAVGLLPRDTD